jgi:hypothetical protein
MKSKVMDSDDRICCICRQHVPPREGHYHIPLGLFYHHNGTCNELVKSFERDYSRSSRGRRRGRKQVLELIAQFQPQQSGETI